MVTLNSNCKSTKKLYNLAGYVDNVDPKHPCAIVHRLGKLMAAATVEEVLQVFTIV